MCEMINLFLPAKGVSDTAEVRGLWFARHGELQRDFRTRFEGDEGTFLAGFRGHCLCGFTDWEAVYEVARNAMLDADVCWAALTHFWSGTRYELAEREIDPDAPGACTPIQIGEVVILRTQPPERRRHRGVVVELEDAVGRQVVLKLKSGRAARGVLTDFDPTSEVGHVEGQVVVAGQVHSVQVEAAEA